MRTLLLAWLLVAVSAIGCSTYATRTGPTQSLEPSFDFVCAAIEDRYKGILCGKLEAPIIVKSKVVERPLAGFYYHGEKYIFIRWDLSPNRVREVVVHETVHYVLDHLNILVSMCSGETIAREITADYDGQAVDPAWKERYGCDKWSTGAVPW